MVESRKRGTLSTGSDEGVVGDHIGLAALPVHFTEQVQGQLPPPCLLTRTDQAAVGYHIPLTASSQLQQHTTGVNCKFWAAQADLLARFACTHSRVPDSSLYLCCSEQ